MSLIGKIFGKVAASGASTVMDSIGNTAIKLRSAITGDLPPEKKAELEEILIDLDKIKTDAKANIIMAEANGRSWLQRNWRPILMLVITIIIANNYIFFPYASIFTDKVAMLDLPDKLWTLMTVGVGGYIAGRTIEKVGSK